MLKNRMNNINTPVRKNDQNKTTLGFLKRKLILLITRIIALISTQFIPPSN